MDKKLGRTIDALPGLVWTARPDGNVDYANQRWCEFTGLTVEDACESRWVSAIHPDDLPAVLGAYRAMLASGTAGEVEGRMRRFDGVYRWLLYRVTPILDESGVIVGWCGINTDIEDRKRAELALRAHEQRLRQIVDGLPVMVVLSGPDGKVVHVNRQTLEYCGVAHATRDWQSAIHPDDRKAADFNLRASFTTGEPFEAEWRHRRADGVYRWFHTRGLPLRDDDRQIVLWYFLLNDIDDRKRAEMLADGENVLLEKIALAQPLPEILDSVCHLVEELDGDCHSGILLIDPETNTFQRGGASRIASPHIDAMHGTSANTGATPGAAAEPGGLRASWTRPILSRNNAALGTFAIYRTAPGLPTSFQRDLIAQLTHIASIAIERARDDIERKQAEEELRRREALMAKAQQLSSSGSFCWRAETGNTVWSEQLYRIFDVDPAAKVTMDMVATRVHPADLHLVHEMRDRALAGDEFESDCRLLLPDGSVRHIHMLGHATRDAHGRIEYIGAVQDVTERRESDEALGTLRAELAHLSRVNSLGAVTASITHEINQPLAGIMTNAGTCLRMLSAERPNIEGAIETARRTIRDGRRASDVMTRLRALFSKKAVACDPVDLNEAAREVVELLRTEVRNHRIVTRLELADDLPTIAGDRVQLQQVVLNLLLNAMDAMKCIEDRPRQLVIRTCQDRADGVCLAVSDTGVGIAPEHAPKLFDAFYTTKKEGMGIGLSVCRSIIESHGGRLSAASNDICGATFTFFVPCRPDIPG